MNSILNAETSAGKVLSATEKEHSIGRNPSDQGNNPAENEQEVPLTYDQKVEIIRAAIEKKHGGRMKDWATFDLSRLINHHEKEGTSPNQWREFFTELLFLIGQPEIAKAFNKALPNGLDKIRKQLEFYEELSLDWDDYHAWCDYMFVPYEEVIPEWSFKDIAKRFLTCTELEMVLAPAEKPKPVTRPWYMSAPEEDGFTLTDDQLVEALDRYYPGKKWPADKKTIATHEKMRSNLTYREKERLSLLAETPEQKQKRLVDAAVYSELNGPTIPALIRSVGEKVDAAIKAPKVLGPDTEIQFRLDKVKMQPLTMDPDEKRSPASINKPTGAVTKKKPAKTPARSGLSKKPAPSKTSTSTSRKPVKQPTKKTSTSKKA